MTDRKKPGVAFWAIVVVAGLVLYLASFGPASWLASRRLLPEWTSGPVEWFYAPLRFLALLGGDPSATEGPEGPFGRVLLWYARFWIAIASE